MNGLPIGAKAQLVSRHSIGVVMATSFVSAVIAGLAVALFFWMNRYGSKLSDVDGRTVANCIDKYLPVVKQPDTGITGIEILYNVANFCYNSTGSQILIDDEVIRRDNFVFQRFETIILMFMVVTITISGVILAGLQLLASYKLAGRGRGELSGGADISYGKDNISFKSSVVGLAILAISFAFFIVFVVEVYTLKDADSQQRPAPSVRQLQNPTQIQNMQPAGDRTMQRVPQSEGAIPPTNPGVGRSK